MRLEPILHGFVLVFVVGPQLAGCALDRGGGLPAGQTPMLRLGTPGLQVRMPQALAAGDGRLRLWTTSGTLLLDEQVTLPDLGASLSVDDLGTSGGVVVAWDPASTSRQAQSWGGFAVLVPGEATKVSLDDRTTAAAAIWRALWTKGGVPAGVSPDDARSAVHDLLFRVPDSHPRLLDISGIADDLRTGVQTSLARAPRTGSVVFGFRGWPRGAEATVRADDESSRALAYVDAATQDGRSLRWSGLAPGRRILELQMTLGIAGTLVATTAVDVPAGGEATASWTLPQWADAPPLPEARSDMAAVAVDRGIWVLGGSSISEAGSLTSLDTCRCLEIGSSAASWSAVPSLPFRTARGSAVTHGGRIWVLGIEGYVASMVLADGPCNHAGDWRLETGRVDTQRYEPLLLAVDGTGPRALVRQVNPDLSKGLAHWLLERDAAPWLWLRPTAQGTWLPATASIVPEPRERDAALMASGDQIFVAGGHSVTKYLAQEDPLNSRRLADVEALDLARDVRRVLPSLPEPLALAALARTSGGLVVSGGEYDVLQTGAANWYLPEGDQSWRPLPPLETARERHALVSIGNALYAVGGTRRSGTSQDFMQEALATFPLESVERLDLAALAALGRKAP